MGSKVVFVMQAYTTSHLPPLYCIATVECEILSDNWINQGAHIYAYNFDSEGK